MRVPKGLGEGGRKLNGTNFPFGVMKIFWKYIVRLVAQSYECIKSHLTVYLKTIKG